MKAWRAACAAKPGTKVTLTIQQDSQENNYELTLRAIEVPTVKTTMVSEDTAYISFTEWSGTTADQFIAQLNALKAQEVKGILLDVRGVTSNELSYAVRLLDPLRPAVLWPIPAIRTVT